MTLLVNALSIDVCSQQQQPSLGNDDLRLAQIKTIHIWIVKIFNLAAQQYVNVTLIPLPSVITVRKCQVVWPPSVILLKYYSSLWSQFISKIYILYFNGLVQDCSNSITKALDLLQSCTKLLIFIVLRNLQSIFQLCLSLKMLTSLIKYLLFTCT